MKTLTLSVGGMTCGGCANSIKKSVGELSGVSSVDVDLSNNQVAVIYDDNQLGQDAIVEAIEDAGFDVL